VREREKKKKKSPQAIILRYCKEGELKKTYFSQR
jgi:hypothetical protein